MKNNSIDYELTDHETWQEINNNIMGIQQGSYFCIKMFTLET